MRRAVLVPLLLVSAIASLPLSGAEQAWMPWPEETEFVIRKALGLAREYQPEVAVQSETAPPSGRYLDPWTSLVYAYDAASGALEPTNEPGSILLYAQVDVYTRGEQSDIVMPDLAVEASPPCDMDFCVRAVVFLTGNPKLEVEIEALATHCKRFATTQVPSPNGAAGPVKYWSLTSGVDYCPPGKAIGRLLIDDVRADEDSAFYS